MPNHSNELNMDKFKDFALNLAAESQRVILAYFNRPIDVEKKEDSSPVTIADREAEEVMRRLIRSGYPEHGIVGEELGGLHEDAEYTWVIDPIDGTKTFICGVPLFGTLISLLRGGEPILGVINLPALGLCMIGDGKETFLNGKRVHVRSCQNLRDAVLLTTDIVNYGKYGDADGFRRLSEEVALCRTWGDCYGYYLLAAGHGDIMIDPIMSYWDIMALIPVVRGAGGVITDLSGGDPVKGKSVLACSPGLHSAVLKTLNP
jgi:histidinol phosphatase-like enzyme (inositol monophosphatase family)